MELRHREDDLWTADAPLKVHGLHLGTRTTIVRLSDGSLVVHSPGPVDAAALQALGPVRALVAPNSMHDLYLEANRLAFPHAQVFVSPGLQKVRPEYHFLGGVGPWPDELPMLRLEGMPRLEEFALYHPRSRTLILTDTVFHIQRAGSLFTRVFQTLNGGYRRFGPTRIMRTFIQDRKALRASWDAVLDWDFDRVVMAHGEVLETGGRQALTLAWAWLKP